MKYIRTKNEIYSLENATICRYKDKEHTCPIRRNETFEEHRAREYQFISPKWEVIKIADTIEELCDEFVVCLKDGDKLLMDGDIRSAKDFFFGYAGLRKTEKVYGAIWTDKGLQFVARMNSKGEFELL